MQGQEKQSILGFNLYFEKKPDRTVGHWYARKKLHNGKFWDVVSVYIGTDKSKAEEKIRAWLSAHPEQAMQLQSQEESKPAEITRQAESILEESEIVKEEKEDQEMEPRTKVKQHKMAAEYRKAKKDDGCCPNCKHSELRKWGTGNGKSMGEELQCEVMGFGNCEIHVVEDGHTCKHFAPRASQPPESARQAESILEESQTSQPASQAKLIKQEIEEIEYAKYNVAPEVKDFVKQTPRFIKKEEVLLELERYLPENQMAIAKKVMFSPVAHVHIDFLEKHPENEVLLPPLTSEEKASLKEKMQAELEPQPFVIIKEDETNNDLCYIVLDGNNRLDILRELGFSHTVPCIVKDAMTIEEQRTYIENCSLARRNLSKEDKASIAKRQVARGISQEDVAKKLGISQQTVSRVTQEVKEARKEAEQEAITTLSSAGLSTREIAEEVGIQKSTVANILSKNTQMSNFGQSNPSTEVTPPPTQEEAEAKAKSMLQEESILEKAKAKEEAKAKSKPAKQAELFQEEPGVPGVSGDSEPAKQSDNPGRTEPAMQAEDVVEVPGMPGITVPAELARQHTPAEIKTASKKVKEMLDHLVESGEDGGMIAATINTMLDEMVGDMPVSSTAPSATPAPQEESRNSQANPVQSELDQVKAENARLADELAKVKAEGVQQTFVEPKPASQENLDVIVLSLKDLCIQKDKKLDSFNAEIDRLAGELAKMKELGKAKLKQVDDVERANAGLHEELAKVKAELADLKETVEIEENDEYDLCEILNKQLASQEAELARLTSENAELARKAQNACQSQNAGISEEAQKIIDGLKQEFDLVRKEMIWAKDQSQKHLNEKCDLEDEIKRIHKPKEYETTKELRDQIKSWKIKEDDACEVMDKLNKEMDKMKHKILILEDQVRGAKEKQTDAESDLKDCKESEAEYRKMWLEVQKELEVAMSNQATAKLGN